MIKKGAVLLLVAALAGCVSNNHVAPVKDAFRASSHSSNYYRVRTGDTLYSVAWSFNLDYLQLARLNHVLSPYKIQVGQMLRIRGSAKNLLKKHLPKKIPVKAPKIVAKDWRWPAAGRVVTGFSISPYGNKGVDIGGKLGESVYSAANGVVVYSGAGVRGYGNLIIVKHKNDYLSAYAFNQRNLTKEGMKVQAGQKIATMGRNNSGTVLLHFELRRNGYPVNPLNYLR